MQFTLQFNSNCMSPQSPMEITSNNCFRWKIPWITNKHKELLCYGYSRIKFNKFITNDIIKLFAKYLTKNKYQLKDIKNASLGRYFNSPFITINNYKFYLLFAPYLRIGVYQYSLLHLVLASKPKKIKKKLMYY